MSSDHMNDSAGRRAYEARYHARFFELGHSAAMPSWANLSQTARNVWHQVAKAAHSYSVDQIKGDHLAQYAATLWNNAMGRNSFSWSGLTEFQKSAWHMLVDTLTIAHKETAMTHQPSQDQDLRTALTTTVAALKASTGAIGRCCCGAGDRLRYGSLDAAIDEGDKALAAPPRPVDAERVGLSLAALREANAARQTEWCQGGDAEPDLAFRGNELAGETGEACNVIKKLERERHGWRGSRATLNDLAEELADVVICADLCAVTAGIDLDAAVVAKFNATSDKVGTSVRLPTSPAHPPDKAVTREGVAGPGWPAPQPIETAPKDGRAILTGNPAWPEPKLSCWNNGIWTGGASASGWEAPTVWWSLPSTFQATLLAPQPTGTEASRGTIPSDWATKRVYGRNVSMIANLIEDRLSRGDQPGANFPAEWWPLIVNAIRAAAPMPPVSPSPDSTGPKGARPEGAIELTRSTFLAAYGKASQSSQPDDWMHAALLAKQFELQVPAATPTPFLSPDSTGLVGDDWSGLSAAEIVRRTRCEAGAYNDQLSGRNTWRQCCDLILSRIAAKPPNPASDVPGEAPTVDVWPMRLSDNRTDYFVRLKCGDRWQTPHVFRERFKAEYEAAHLQWVLGLRSDKPDLMAYSEASHPNDAHDRPCEAQTQEGGRWKEGCCSAIAPCPHQQRDKTTLCDACDRASRLHSAPADRSEGGRS